MMYKYYSEKYIGYPDNYKLDAEAAIGIRDLKNGVVSSRYYRHPDFF